MARGLDLAPFVFMVASPCERLSVRCKKVFAYGFAYEFNLRTSRICSIGNRNFSAPQIPRNVMVVACRLVGQPFTSESAKAHREAGDDGGKE
jgi:hypothetical protein